MTGLEAYRLFLGLKLHFQPGSTYDFNLYGSSKASLQAFEARKDKLHFLKLAKHKDPQSFLIANLSKNPKAWVGNLAYKPEAEKIYLEREKRIQSIVYTVTEETHRAAEGEAPDKLFRTMDGIHPPILQAYIAGSVSLETMVVLDSIVGMCNTWDATSSWDPIIKQTVESIKKMKPFVQFNTAEIKQALEKKFAA